jgi:hypothetical protein
MAIIIIISIAILLISLYFLRKIHKEEGWKGVCMLLSMFVVISTSYVLIAQMTVTSNEDIFAIIFAIVFYTFFNLIIRNGLEGNEKERTTDMLDSLLISVSLSYFLKKIYPSVIKEFLHIERVYPTFIKVCIMYISVISIFGIIISILFIISKFRNTHWSNKDN